MYTTKLCAGPVFLGHFCHLNSLKTSVIFQTLTHLPPVFPHPSSKQLGQHPAGVFLPVCTLSSISRPFPITGFLLLHTLTHTLLHEDFLLNDTTLWTTNLQQRPSSTITDCMWWYAITYYTLMVLQRHLESKLKSSIFLKKTTNTYIPYYHSRNGNTNTYSKPEPNPSDILYN